MIVALLPIIMELNGLTTSTTTQLMEATGTVMQYIVSHIHLHMLSLNKGNYLTVHTEKVNFVGGNVEKSIDGLILKSTIWQDDHW